MKKILRKKTMKAKKKKIKKKWKGRKAGKRKTRITQKKGREKKSVCNCRIGSNRFEGIRRGKKGNLQEAPR